MALETSPDAAGTGPADRERDLVVDRPARRGVGRGPGRPGDPPARRADGLHDPARLGGRHLGARHLRARPASTPRPAAGRGGERRDPREAVLLRQPRHPLAAGPRDPDGRARRAARAPRAAPPAAGRRGAVRPRAASGRCRSCPAGSGWSPRRGRRPSATSSRTPPAAGRRSRFEVAYAAMQGPRSARGGDRGARAARRATRRRRDRDRPRRRFGRGPAAVLRRGPDPRRRKPPARRWSRRSATSPTRRCSTWWPTSARPRPPTRPGCIVPDVAEETPGRRLGARPAARAARSVARARAGRPRRAALPAGAGRPAHPARRARRRAERPARAGSTHALPPARPGGRRHRPPPGPRARLSPLATLERGYAVLQDADGHVVTSIDGHRARARRVACASSTAACTPPPTGSRRSTIHQRETPMADEAVAPDQLSYEEAREQLVEVVRTPRGRRHDARGVAGALGARREARHRLPVVARRSPQAPRRGRGGRRGVEGAGLSRPARPGAPASRAGRGPGRRAW